MLTARQKAVAAAVARLQQRLGQLPAIDTDSKEKAELRQDVQEHLTAAKEMMEQFDQLVRKSFYRPQDEERLMAQASGKLDAVAEELDLARMALAGQLEQNIDQQRAKEAERIAKELMAMADAFDESVTPAERERMLAALKEADQLLAMIAPYEVEVTDEPINRAPRPSGGEQPGPAAIGGGGIGAGGVPSGQTVTSGRYEGDEDAETARFLARKFWSVAVSAKKQNSVLVEDDASDAEFRQQEKDFFEKAATYE